jgi:hypothetical protein
MILLWGVDADTPMELIRRRLDAAHQRYVFLNQADVLDLDVEIRYEPQPVGWIAVDGVRHDLHDFTAFYLRPYDFRQFPDFVDVAPSSEEWHHAVRFEDILCGYADVAPLVVVNRPSAMQANNSKPYQCSLIEGLGFRIPRTLLTTVPTAVPEFARECDGLIYKSISGQRSIVRGLAADDGARLGDVRWCPTQFQEQIPGDDYRVHVVDGATFATRVRSSATDYRYGRAAYEPAEVPEDVSRRCVSVAGSMGLPLAGIDLRKTPDGEWYCFEVNPCPAYSCYEMATGQPISGAVAALLAGVRFEGPL